jgi:hypothetical protein
MKRSEDRLQHHQDVAGPRSPFTRGRALEHMVNVEQLPKSTYVSLCSTTGAAQPVFFFVLGYSRVGGPDVVR